MAARCVTKAAKIKGSFQQFVERDQFMPSTLREIADQCGVTRQTVNNYLHKLGLWDDHVSTGESGRAAIVDDYAASVVAAKIGVRITDGVATQDDVAEEESDKFPQLDDENAESIAAFSDAWEKLCQALRQQIDYLQEQNDSLKAELKEKDAIYKEEIDRKDQRISELSTQLTSSLATIKALPSADAVGDARRDGKRDGEEEERTRIATMGFFQRRRYLKSAGHKGRA